MQIVIDIDDNLYTRLFDNGIDNYDDAVDMVKAIRKGTPLPKRHGRLIDADAFNEELDNLDYDTYNDYSNTFDWIEEAPTIIEADKEVENE